MKINISSIIRDHVHTLHADGEKGVDKSDLSIFYGLPLIVASLAFYYAFAMPSDVHSLSITFFGIFIALLLNIQVAIFSIFQRKWDAPSDVKLARVHFETVRTRRILLSELNANISYLILICCVCLILSVWFYIQKISHSIAPAAMIALYFHFVLTLIMIVKRSHALFQKEYRDSPD